MAKQGGEVEHHIVGVKVGGNGVGNLDIVLRTLDNVRSQNLVPLILQNPTDRENTRLANFQSQRIQLEFSVDEMNEWFSLSRIIIFAKPVAIEYPSVS